jgi:hypothetical protein
MNEASEGVLNGVVAEKRALRRKKARDRKKRSKEASAQAKLGVKTWKPGERYTLLQGGSELDKPPHQAWENNELRPKHLFHFRSNDPSAKRCAMVEGLSKYESVLRVSDMEPGMYILPIHEHLEQITRGYDQGRAEEILESGVPYFPDKRLRRLRDELFHNGGRQKRKKRTGAAAAVSRTKARVSDMRGLTEKHLRAVIPIDNYVSSVVSNSTRQTQDKNGTWNTSRVDLKVLPSLQKQSALVKDLPAAFREIGECHPRTREEIEARAKAQKVKEDAAVAAESAKKKKRKRPAAAGGRRRKGASVVADMKLGDAPKSLAPPADMQDYYYASSSEDEAAKIPATQVSLRIPSGDEEWEAGDTAFLDQLEDYAEEEPLDLRQSGLAQDDVEQGEFARMALTHRADGRKAGLTHGQQVKRATAHMTKTIARPPAVESSPKRKRGRKPQAKKKRLRKMSELNKVDQFVERAIDNPDADTVPEEWREIVHSSPDEETARERIQQTSHYQMVLAVTTT